MPRSIFCKLLSGCSLAVLPSRGRFAVPKSDSQELPLHQDFKTGKFGYNGNDQFGCARRCKKSVIGAVPGGSRAAAGQLGRCAVPSPGGRWLNAGYSLERQARPWRKSLIDLRFRFWRFLCRSQR
jgi:hypothetical protein